MIAQVEIGGHLYEIETDETGKVIRKEAKDPATSIVDDPDKVEALALIQLDPSTATTKQIAKALQLLLKKFFKN